MPPSADMLDPVMLASLEGLELRARALVDGYLSGSHRSAGRGYSAEFAEHREYTPGDDPRYVDWKIYGRTDRIFLKQFEAETDLVCYLLVDASESMAYQSNPASLSKWEIAQCLAVSLAHLVLRARDRVSLTLFDHRVRRLLPPSSRPAMREQVVDILTQARCGGKSSIGSSLHELAGRLQKRGVVVVLSDFLDDTETVLAGLKHLRYQRHEVIALQLLDPAELDFPFVRPTWFRGLESTGDLLVQPRAVREAYRAAMKRHLSRMRAGCREARVDYQLVRTDEPLTVALKRLLARRP